jgi:hypothetical protein
MRIPGRSVNGPKDHNRLSETDRQRGFAVHVGGQRVMFEDDDRIGTTLTSTYSVSSIIQTLCLYRYPQQPSQRPPTKQRTLPWSPGGSITRITDTGMSPSIEPILPRSLHIQHKRLAFRTLTTLHPELLWINDRCKPPTRRYMVRAVVVHSDGCDRGVVGSRESHARGFGEADVGIVVAENGGAINGAGEEGR